MLAGLGGCTRSAPDTSITVRNTDEGPHSGRVVVAGYGLDLWEGATSTPVQKNPKTPDSAPDWRNEYQFDLSEGEKRRWTKVAEVDGTQFVFVTVRLETGIKERIRWVWPEGTYLEVVIQNSGKVTINVYHED